MTVSRVLIVASVIMFVLAFFGVPFDPIQGIALGLALFSAGHVV